MPGILRRVGTRALFATTDSLGLTDVMLRLLDSAQVVKGSCGWESSLCRAIHDAHRVAGQRVVAVMRGVELFTALAFNVQPPVDVTMS